MRKSLIILLLFVFACQSREDEILSRLNETIDKCNSEIGLASEAFSIHAEKLLKEDPTKAIPLKNNIDQININSERIFCAIGQLEHEMLIRKDEQVQIPGNKRKALLSMLDNYNALIDSLLKNSYNTLQYLKNEIELFKSNPEKYKIQDFKLLANCLRNTNYLALDYLNSKNIIPEHGENKFQVAVVPQSKYLYINDSYKADIYLFPIDSNATFTVEIDKKSLTSRKGMVEYLDSNTKHQGIVHKKGRIKVDYYGVTFYYPFGFNYEIVTK
jgi:hypothetical protein